MRGGATDTTTRGLDLSRSVERMEADVDLCRD